MKFHKQRHAALFAGDGYVPRIGANLAQHGALLADVGRLLFAGGVGLDSHLCAQLNAPRWLVWLGRIPARRSGGRFVALRRRRHVLAFLQLCQRSRDIRRRELGRILRGLGRSARFFQTALEKSRTSVRLQNILSVLKQPLCLKK